MTGRRAAAVALALGLTTAACGSTAPRVADDAIGAGNGELGGGPNTAGGGEPSPATVPGGQGTAAASRAGAAGAPRPGSGASSPAPASVPTAGRIPAGRGVHGVTDATVEVGIWTMNTETLDATQRAVGGGTAEGRTELGDVTAGAQAVVDYVNKNGGAAGRKVVPRYHEVNIANVTTNSSREQEVQRACADWTEDHHVFAMMQLPFGEGLECAVATDTVHLAEIINSGAGWLTESMFARAHDVWYAPNMVLVERRDRGLVEALARQSYLAPGSKVGIMIEDDPAAKESVTKVMLPALARHGVRPAVQIVYPEVFGSPWDNYILQMQAAGVTHVVWSAGVGGHWSTLLAMRAAENQRYYPKWGVASDQWPGFLIGYSAPRAQVANTQGMGWLPSVDIQRSDALDHPYSGSSAAAVCKQIERDSGVGAARLYCESLFFLKFVLDRAAEVSPAGMNAALARVADGYSSVHAMSGLTSFGPESHDGVTRYRDLVFDDRCGEDAHPCFKYAGPPAILP